jgi:hypothetical protein
MNRFGFHLVESPTIQCKKLMIIIVWNPSRFHLIRVLPSGRKFNKSDHRKEVFAPFSEWRREQASGAGRKLTVHVENARPHIHSGSILRIYGEGFVSGIV